MRSVRAFLFWWLVALGLGILAPLVWPSAIWIATLSKAAILCLFALSYNVMLGQTGLLSFGHCVYFGIPAYACLHLVTAIGKAGLPVPLELVPAFGGLVGGLLGLVIGRAITRQAGTAFAMITLGIGELAHAAAYVFQSFFGGEPGISTDRMVDRTLTGFSFGPAIQVYYLNLAWVAGVAALLWLATRTPLGRAAVAVRENPERIAFLGYDPRTVRWFQVTISGAAAGVAGALFALTYEIATAEVLSLKVSANVLVATYLGGTGFFAGPILGAALVTLFEQVVGKASEAWLLYYGMLFVAVVMFAPNGIAGLLADIARNVRRTGVAPLATRVGAVLPGLLCLGLGIVLLVETAFRLSNSLGGSARASFFGLGYEVRGAVPWLAAGLLIAAGAALLAIRSRLARRAIEAGR